MLSRRQFLISAPALALMPASAQAYSAQTFTPGLWQNLRETSDVVILNYRASWSLTCQIKAEILARLIAENAEFARLNFIDVDWDTFGPSVLTQRLGVERRSTLLLIKGGEEIARLVNEPYERPIRALLEQALKA